MSPVVRKDLLQAQRSLLQVMEAYATELAVRRLPIPYRLRDGLRLQREFGRRPTRPRRP
ncbi:hypothetical protein [Ornithinicoccus halotolerans]|uniref:hypothetical protein n=1 Tax=Ornithinicoccus halotolerans TaxID=1748220 RepID=UPI001295D4A7|nr:hypothetical protein [Ornithinicoccus halotolerans]